MAELIWMVASPLAMACLVAGLAVSLRRVAFSPVVLRYQARLGRAAALAMGAFLAGAECWVVAGSRGPRGLFRVGTIDLIDLVVMTGALLVALRAMARARPPAALV